MTSDAIHFLTIPPSREVAEQGLSPCVRDWFAATFDAPTMAQRCAWPTILSGQNLLLSSPTGSGKTLAALVPIFSRLLDAPADGLQCLYIAPLKALCRDVRTNLRSAWRSLRDRGNLGDADLRVGLRTGDTSWRVRQRQISDPPTILVTTPESLAQLLTQPFARDLFQTPRWIVVDEIHALAGSKRGADLAISLERLESLTREPPRRIGLSATCTPLATVAEFLAGDGRTCTVAAVADRVETRYVIEPLFEDRSYSPSWMATLVDRLDAELMRNRTTLIFTNTRNLAERVTWALRRRYPERQGDIAVHHSALSPARRRVVERRMKHGRLWTVVSSTSLELGIDIGTVDLVVFVHPPGAVVRLLQRVGRSGHCPGEPRRGLLLTASPGELIEATVTAGSGRDGQIEPVRMASAPLDVLCQQIAGIAMAGWATPRATFELVRRAAPFRDLAWADFQDCLDYLSGRRPGDESWLPARLRWQDGLFTILDAKTARRLRRSLGTILTEDACVIRLRDPAAQGEDARTLGEVDQVYADRLQPGDRFVLDGRCLEMKKRQSGGLVVEEVFGRPQVPRWLGAGVPMPNELARRIFLFRAQAAEILRDGEPALTDWLRRDYHLDGPASAALIRLLQEQETVSEIPTPAALSIECVAMQACAEAFLHTPLPRSANEAIARVLVWRWGRKSRNVVAVAADLGIYLMTFEPTPISPEMWRERLAAARFVEDFHDHLRSGEMLANQFGRVAQTGLMVLRQPAGRKRKVGGADWIERRLFEQMRNACPDFVLLRQAEREAMSACDVAGAVAYLRTLAALPIRVRHLPRPSPFGESLLQAGFPPGAEAPHAPKARQR